MGMELLGNDSEHKGILEQHGMVHIGQHIGIGQHMGMQGGGVEQHRGGQQRGGGQQQGLGGGQHGGGQQGFGHGGRRSSITIIGPFPCFLHFLPMVLNLFSQKSPKYYIFISVFSFLVFGC